jgi:hypothetical protein
MKFLCLAYGSEADWNVLPRQQQEELLAQDEVLRRRGDLVGALGDDVTVVQAWEGTPQTSNNPVSLARWPLAGFGIIEAADVDEAVRLVANTPCARAGGAIELRPILANNDVGGRAR